MDLDATSEAMTALLHAGVREAVRTADSATFLAWMRQEAPRRFDEVFGHYPPAHVDRAATWLGVAIWNVTPLPGNGFRPRPLVRAQRNAPCVCGSGRKLKHCCGEPPRLPHIPEEAAWEALLATGAAQAALEAAAAAGKLPAPRLGQMAQRLLDTGRPHDALALVEPLFTHPEMADESWAQALDTLFTALLVLGRQQQRERVVDRLTKELRPPLRAQAWARQATMMADKGRHDEAWTAWEHAWQDDPSHASLVELEVTLLLVRGDLARAAERARFHRKRLGRRGLEALAAPELLDAAASDPLTTALQLTVADAWQAARRLADLAEATAAKPIEVRYRVVPSAEPGAGAGTLARSAELGRVERQWRRLFSRGRAALEGAIWDEEVAASWLELLEANGPALDSFEVLFDAAVLAPRALGAHGVTILTPRLAPLIDRGLAILDILLGDHPGLKLAPEAPSFTAVVGLVVAGAAGTGGTAGGGPAGARLAVLQRLARLYRDEPEVHASLAVMHLLRGEAREALAAAASAPAHPAGLLDVCQALALYQLDRKGEALSALSSAVLRFPEAVHRLASRDAIEPGVAEDDATGRTLAEALRLLIGRQPEMQRWLRDLTARHRPRASRRAVTGAPVRGSRSPAAAALPAAAKRPAGTKRRSRSADGVPPPAGSGPGGKLLVVKVTLLDTRPPIWRRLEVSSSLTLAKLHRVLQAAMGWTDSHLHMFRAGREHFSDRSFDLDPPARDERRATLGQLLRHTGDTIGYEYDFGDGWEHRIELEEELPPHQDGPGAVCIGGARHCPPEDCGGVGGFAELLDTLRGNDSAERRELIEWLGGEIDFGVFDRDEVNRRLARVR